MMALPSAHSNDAVAAVAGPQQPAAAAAGGDPEPAGWGGRRVTVATMDLKISVTMDAGKLPLTIDELERVEDDFHSLKKKARSFMQTAISNYGVDEAGTPPEKCMKISISGGPWTTSLIVRKPKPVAVENYSLTQLVPAEVPAI